MKSSKLFSLLILAAFAAMPIRASALVVFAEKPIDFVSPGDAVLVSVYADTEGEEINSIDGAVVIDGAATVSALTTGGSVFNLWPEKPSLSGNRISFTGGTQSGVHGTKLKLFTISLTPSENRNVLIHAENITGYAADGTGRKISGKTRATTVAVTAGGEGLRDDLSALVLSDTTPPEKFAIDLGRDANLYDGKYFITFYADDADTGIQRYEVTEGDYGMVRSGSTYVLRDQTLETAVEVKAIDMAGNIRTVWFDPETSFPWIRLVWLVLAIVLIAASLVILKKKKAFRRKK